MREAWWGGEDPESTPPGSGHFNHSWLLLTLVDMLGTAVSVYMCVYMFLTSVLVCAFFCVFTLSLPQKIPPSLPPQVELGP